MDTRFAEKSGRQRSPKANETTFRFTSSFFERHSTRYNWLSFLSQTKAGVIFVIFCKKQKFHEL